MMRTVILRSSQACDKEFALGAVTSTVRARCDVRFAMVFVAVQVTPGKSNVEASADRVTPIARQRKAAGLLVRRRLPTEELPVR